MTTPVLKNPRLRTVGEYVGGVLLCLVIVIFVMKLWRANLRTPFEYGGDAVFHGMVIKGIIDNGWYLRNNFIGMPGGGELFYFPMADNLHFLFVKAFSFFTNDYALILNLYFLLTFPLTTISSLYVLRHFKIPYLVAALGSLLYTFLPYHFFRNEHHLVLAGYYVVPLSVMVILWIASGRLMTIGSQEKTAVRGLSLRKRYFIASLVICLFIASGGLGYYAFFTCFFLLVAGIAAASCWHTIRHLLVALILIGAVFAGMVINLIPNVIYRWNHGESRTVMRGTEEAELYGLKISQMLLPIDRHRIKTLSSLKEKYNRSAPLVNENGNATLGIVGSIGFLTLLGWLLFRKPFATQVWADHETTVLFSHLSVLTISGVLLATIGGFASLFALFISPQIRSYNRISVYLAFFSLFAVMLILDGLLGRRGNSRTARNLFPVLLAAILLVGILDQTGNGIFVPQYAEVSSENASDAEFVGRIESTVGSNSMIFQLPYVPFPENPPVNKMQDYDHFRPYLHSHNLRWSYGAIKELANDRWQRATAGLSPDQFLEAIALAGFSGIYIDRGGYTDAGADIEAKLRSRLGIAPIVSPNGRMLFFDLAEYKRQLASTNAEQLELKRQKFLHPLALQWTGGFSDLETAGDLDWRWCSSSGELVFENPLDREKKIKLTMGLATGYGEFANLSLDGSLISQKLKINMQPTDFSQIIVLPPGRHVIRFTCDARQVNAPLDPRVLVFKVLNFRFEETE
jgi:phosphoglycerol transferase